MKMIKVEKFFSTIKQYAKSLIALLVLVIVKNNHCQQD